MLHPVCVFIRVRGIRGGLGRERGRWGVETGVDILPGSSLFLLSRSAAVMSSPSVSRFSQPDNCTAPVVHILGAGEITQTTEQVRGQGFTIDRRNMVVLSETRSVRYVIKLN